MTQAVSPLQPPLVQSPQPSMQTQRDLESIFGIVLFRKPKSLGRYDVFMGVVTSRRMIFAQETNEMSKNAVEMARQQAKAEGKGFFGQWSDQLKASFNYSQRYLTMEPSAILSETQGNFAVDNSTISEIKLSLENSRNYANVNEFKVEITSNSARYEFRMDENNQYLQFLKQVYGDRVKTPGYFSSHGVSVHI
jgi:hypothetical protein